MLSKIEIKNFKAIQGEPLILNELAQVNYLVGKNGSGKSSVLEGINMFIHTVRWQFIETGEITYSEETETISCLYNIDIDKISSLINLQHVGEKFVIILDNIDLILSNDKNHEEKVVNATQAIIQFLSPSKIKADIKISLSGEDVDLLLKKSSRLNSHGSSLIDYKIRAFSIINNNEKSKTLQNDFLEKIMKEIKILSNKIYRDGQLVDDKNLSGGEPHLITSVNRILSEVEEPDVLTKKLILIDEPEVGLHPDWQKQIPELFKMISEITNTKFLISTHSPFIINSALQFDNQNVYHIQNGICLNPDGYNKALVNSKTVYSVHSDLGMLPSDLLFSNCLVWVEGPVDAIYINFWLEKYIEENGLPKLTKGIDYEFALLGGASAQNFYLLPDDYEFEYKEDSKIFDMLKIHPNSFVIVDNDGGSLLEGKNKKGNSNFEEFKQNIIAEFDEKDYWYDPDPINFTIECYRKGLIICNDEKGRKDFIKDSKSQSKKDFALKYFVNNKDNKFSQIVYPSCKVMIQKLFSKISNTDHGDMVVASTTK